MNKQEIAQALIHGEAISEQAEKLPLSDLVTAIDTVNEVASNAEYGISDAARAETDRITLLTVRRLADEQPTNSALAHELVFSLIGMANERQKTEAFETLFPVLPPQGKIDALNDLREQLAEHVGFGTVGLDDELGGLLKKHSAVSGNYFKTVGGFLAQNGRFALAENQQIIFVHQADSRPASGMSAEM